MNNNLQKYKKKQILMLGLELLSLVLSIFNLLFLILGLIFGISAIYYFIKIMKEKRKLDNSKKNIREEFNENANSNYTQKKKNESNIKEEIYIQSFKNINIYDIRKPLKEEFIKKLKRSRELEYENFIRQSGTNSKPNDFVVFDLETTGLSPENSEIIEIGAIRFRNNEPTEILHTYIKPNKKISKKITSINGITNEMVEESPSIEEVIPKFIDFIGEDVLIAHNSSFDMKFILSKIYDQGYKKLKNKTIDTLKLSRQKIREYDFVEDKDIKLSSYKLENLKYAFGLYDVGSHNAIDDCKVCAYVYLKIKQSDDDYCYV